MPEMFNSYLSNKNLGELNNALDFAAYRKKREYEEQLARDKEIRASQGEGLNTAIDLATRIGVAIMTGNPTALVAPEAVAQGSASERYGAKASGAGQPRQADTYGRDYMAYDRTGAA